MATENQTATEHTPTPPAKRNVWSKLLAARGEFYAAGAKKQAKTFTQSSRILSLQTSSPSPPRSLKDTVFC